MRAWGALITIYIFLLNKDSTFGLFVVYEHALLEMRILERESSKLFAVEISDDLFVRRRKGHRNSREMLVEALGATRIRLKWRLGSGVCFVVS